MSETIIAAYSDGGVIGKNPSARGGTWAWCHVSAQGERVTSASGVVEPLHLEGAPVTNNQTELIAAVKCLKALPDGWAGVLYTDSAVTLYRVTRPRTRWEGIPDFLRAQVGAARARLGAFTAVLLGGHPTRRELREGFRKDGKPVSEHNCWCDDECRRQAFHFGKAVAS